MLGDAYRTINIEFRTEPPTDFALFAHVEITGTDPNGQGLFGYDNTTQPAGFHPVTNAAQTLYIPESATQGADKFDWLLHLDRHLVNPLELLHVSAVRNHELTQQFVDAGAALPSGVFTGTAHKHYAPWFVPEAILYRFFELAYTPDLMNGLAEKGRTPGKIAFGLYVVDSAGQRPGFLRALARAALGTLGVVLAGGGFVPMLTDPARRAFHDRLLGTRVIQA